MKTILKTVKNFIVGKPIPEKVLTLLFSGDQESVNLAFLLLNIDAHDLLKPAETVRGKRRLMKRIKKELKRRNYEVRFIVNDSPSHVASITIRKMDNFRSIIK
jgi:hypothetical protein